MFYPVTLYVLLASILSWWNIEYVVAANAVMVFYICLQLSDIKKIIQWQKVKDKGVAWRLGKIEKRLDKQKRLGKLRFDKMDKRARRQRRRLDKLEGYDAVWKLYDD